MNKPAFIFDDVRVRPDRQSEIHHHPQWELAYIICGKGVRTIGDRTDRFCEGEIILIPPDIPHVWHFAPGSADSEGDIANICVFFETALIEGLSALLPEISQPLMRLKSRTDAVCYSGEAYRKILSLLQSMRNLNPETRLPSMMSLLTALADTDHCQQIGSKRLLNKAETRMEKVRIYCACNYTRSISLGEIAAHVGMNRSAFCTFMRRQTGMTLSEYINDIRLRKTMELLRFTDENISSIAYEAGFSNVTYFNRLFRARYGCNPKTIRDTARKQI